MGKGVIYVVLPVLAAGLIFLFLWLFFSWIRDRAWENAKKTAMWQQRTRMSEHSPGVYLVSVCLVARVGKSKRVLKEVPMQDPYGAIKVEWLDDPRLVEAQARASALADTWNALPRSTE